MAIVHTKKNFHQVDSENAAKELCRKINRRLLLKFSTEKCNPCKVFNTYFKDFEPADELDIVEIDAMQHQEMARGFGIRALPTFIIMDVNGTVVVKKSGLMYEDEFVVFLKENYFN